MRFLITLLLLLLLLAGVLHYFGVIQFSDIPEMGPEAPDPELPWNMYENFVYGFAIAYPHDMYSTSTVTSSYIPLGGWKAYGAPEAEDRGERVVTFALSRSNDVTAAELRVGVSEHEDEVAECLSPPLHATRTGTEDVDGEPFSFFEAEDAAMNHYLKVKGYRFVHKSRCFAFDLMVYGSNPDVFDPPRPVPFSHEEAFERLLSVLHTLDFK